MLTALAFLTLVAVSDSVQTKSSMDFWVGEWEVYLADGKLVGHNKIEKVMGGAAIIENWVNAGGGEGKSWFYWMADQKQWKQVWVTPDSAYKEKVATVIEDGLLFTGTTHLPDGTTYPDRTRLTLSGKEVKQVIEVSRDGGRTWTAVWDSVYRRKG